MHNVFTIPVAVARTPYAPSSSFLSPGLNAASAKFLCGFPPGVCSVTQMEALASKDSVGMLTPLQRACPPLFPIGHRVLGGP